MTSWQPKENGLKEIVHLLEQTKTSNTQVHKQINKKLEEYNQQIPDFNNYLAYIFASLKSVKGETRQLAGIILKNNLKTLAPKMNPQALKHITQLIIQALSDETSFIRNTAGSNITSLITTMGLERLPGLLQALLQMTTSQQQTAVEGAMAALLKICEDNATQLDSEKLGRPLNVLIPKLISFFSHPNENVRRCAVSAVVSFLGDMPNAILVNMESLLQGIFKLANDKNKRIKREVCKAFVSLLERPEYLKPYMKNIFEYMLHCTQDTDEQLALEACEFWSALTDLEGCKEYFSLLKQFLPRLLPVLLKSMVYSEIDRFILDEESREPDKDTDIAPSKFFVHSKVKSFHDKDSKSSSELQGMQNDEEEEEEDDDDDDAGDQYEDYHSHDWNLRKSSALSLDYIAATFGDYILPIVLPIIQQRMHPSQEWWIRESAILAIGAIADGCRKGMEKYLPELIPYLGKHLSDEQPLVRSITCWSISRYSRWIVDQKPEAFFKPVLFGILKLMMDPNKKVQAASCSALITLEEAAGPQLLSQFALPIVQVLAKAITMYGKKNILNIYDCLGTLADLIGSDMNKPEIIKTIMPPLISKWNSIDNTDRKIFPLLECLSSLASAMGLGFQQFAQPVWQRCLAIIENTYMAAKIARETGDEPPEKDFITCSLDLLGGIVEGLGSSVEGLVANTNILRLLYQCMQDESSEVRQSAFGLLGDLARTCIGHLKGVLREYLAILINNLTASSYSVSNNACWAIGEIAMQVGKPMKPYVESIMSKLVQIINSKNVSISLLENAAITIGRLGLICPEVIAPHLESFSKNWCLTLCSIKHEVEKEQAFKGLCNLIRTNPKGVSTSFAYVCDAIASFKRPPQNLQYEFRQILHGFKNSYGDKWNQFFATFPPKLRQKLQEGYQL